MGRKLYAIKNFIIIIRFIVLFSIVFQLSHVKESIGQLKREEQPVNNIKIITETGHIVFQCLVTTKPEFNVVDTMTYRWYNGKRILKNQGGFSGRLLHGSYNEYLTSGQIVSQGEYFFGVKDGPWKQWDKNGKMTSVMRFKEGLPDGSCKRYTNGRLNSYCFYKEGLLHGKYMVYKADTIFSEKTFKNGLLIDK